MTNEPEITLVGNLTDDPELTYTGGGAAVCNFTVAQTPATYNRQTNEWDQGQALFMRCSVWRQQAENVAESLRRGMEVIVRGTLGQNNYETRSGEKRVSIQMTVSAVGPTMRYATAAVTRNPRRDSGAAQSAPQQQRAPQGGGGQQSQPQRQDDPWGTTSRTDEPPF